MTPTPAGGAAAGGDGAPSQAGGQRLAGRSVLVAGATGALGSRIAHGLAGRGARLTLHGRDGGRLDALAGDVGGAATVSADLRDPAAPARLVDAAVEAHDGLDGVVYAAGVVAFGSIADLDDDVLDDLFLLNVLAPVRLARAALAHLGEGGFLVHLSAVVAERPVAGMAAYCASKGALSAFDGAAAHELRRRKVHVLDVRPPHTETGLAGRALAGTAPSLPQGKGPDAVAERIVAALLAGERELAAAAF